MASDAVCTFLLLGVIGNSEYVFGTWNDFQRRAEGQFSVSLFPDLPDMNLSPETWKSCKAVIGIERTLVINWMASASPCATPSSAAWCGRPAFFYKRLTHKLLFLNLFSSIARTLLERTRANFDGREHRAQLVNFALVCRTCQLSFKSSWSRNCYWIYWEKTMRCLVTGQNRRSLRNRLNMPSVTPVGVPRTCALCAMLQYH